MNQLFLELKTTGSGQTPFNDMTPAICLFSLLLNELLKCCYNELFLIVAKF